MHNQHQPTQILIPQHHKHHSINKKNQEILPQIPNKIYFTIGEVSKLCLIESYVLRYWEKEFPQLNPPKRRGNRRYYTRKEILLIRDIKNLLYIQGFTIDGARTRLSTKEKNDIDSVNNINNDESLKLIEDVIFKLNTILSEIE